MKRRCVGGKAHTKNPAYAGVELRMTMDEWIAWALPKYSSLEQPPSVSRKGDVGHYEIGNIEIIPFLENMARRATPGRAVDGIKRCSTCREKKKVESFSKNKSHFDGYAHQCKSCVSDYHKGALSCRR